MANETQVQKFMRLLDCSEEEARQIIADDKAIDKGERMSFDLDPEKEKEAKKMAKDKNIDKEKIEKIADKFYVSKSKLIYDFKNHCNSLYKHHLL